MSQVTNCRKCATVLIGEHQMDVPGGAFYTFYCECGNTQDHFVPLRDE